MSNKQSPLQIVKDKFGSKKELASKLAGILEPAEGESKEELAERLVHVANAKLLHLHGLAAKVEGHGGREGLVKALSEAEGKTKDADYLASLGKRSLGWLVDRVESLAKKSKAG
ncbi:hypothetical protein G6O69_12265 [Pseudenhygromyxa sp. WMMC2535]|uniref:hypothetical protein n=1 Tax=Pseudenhygromyxa sp. WMMC2535 TaxID=2712867 RepID=UPI001551DDFA|nr:hypothetical protein [Pseudenhygromyxa sp. WMMC2535]NVB38606.1 hypothetical protein [Pseudenhygromyxa sp. WMMC2535]